MSDKEPHYAQLGAPRKTRARWSAPDAQLDAQISIKASSKVVEEFRAICCEDRRIYGEMLEILVNLYNDQVRRKS
jgi:hypothetical protein